MPSPTLGPGSPGCPGLPLKPWGEKRAGLGSGPGVCRASGGSGTAHGTPTGHREGDRERQHSPGDPSSLVARGDRCHPREKKTLGVSGGVQGVAAHPQDPSEPSTSPAAPACRPCRPVPPNQRGPVGTRRGLGGGRGPEQLGGIPGDQHGDRSAAMPPGWERGTLTWMPGGPGGPGGPGMPVGPRMPSLPCGSHRRVGGGPS